MKIATLLSAVILAAVTSAATDADIQIILKAAPKSISCADAPPAGSNQPGAGQCAEAKDVAGPVIAAFEKHKLTTAGEQANILAWMAFESGDFKYWKGTFPLSPPPPAGKGTRCMMSPEFNKEFAATVQNTETDPAKMLQRLIDDGYEYEACAWYYDTKCNDEVKKAVQAGTKEGHVAFLTKCVNTSVDDDRLKVWTATSQAFGLSGE